MVWCFALLVSLWAVTATTFGLIVNDELRRVRHALFLSRNGVRILGEDAAAEASTLADIDDVLARTGFRLTHLTRARCVRNLGISYLSAIANLAQARNERDAARAALKEAFASHDRDLDMHRTYERACDNDRDALRLKLDAAESELAMMRGSK